MTMVAGVSATMSIANRVCAIVPTYERPDLVKETVESILKQTRRPDAIIVACDGGDREATAISLSSFKNDITLSWRPNAGKAATLNYILSECDSDLIWIVDDDDVVKADALAELEAALQNDPDAMFSFGLHDELVKVNDNWSSVPLPAPDLTQSLKLSVLRRCFIFQPGMLVRREAYSIVGEFDPTLLRSQDYDMLLRLTRNMHGAFVNRAVFHQRRHEGLRGPALQRTSSSGRYQKWAEAEQAIFQRIYATYDLLEFAGTSFNSHLHAEGNALLNRSVIMARRGLWVLAARDLRHLTKLTAEGLDLRQLDFSSFSSVFGAQSYALSGHDVEPFFNAIKRLPHDVRNNALRHTASHLLGWIRGAISKRQWARIRLLARIAKHIGLTNIVIAYSRGHMPQFASSDAAVPAGIVTQEVTGPH